MQTTTPERLDALITRMATHPDLNGDEIAELAAGLIVLDLVDMNPRWVAVASLVERDAIHERLVAEITPLALATAGAELLHVERTPR